MLPNLLRLNMPRLLLTGAILAAGGLVRAESAPTGPAKVEVRRVDGQWRLWVNHQPFFIKGAGLEVGEQEKLAACGGNSFRTWTTRHGRQTLDRALKNGLYVTLGLDVARERHGFDYSDPQAVARQLAEIKAQVLEFKDHPALLMWDIGNELNLESHNPRVWDAVNDISKMIHRVDPNHPTTTSVAGLSRDLVTQIKHRAPDLDLLSVQFYADIVNLPRRLQNSGWDGPYAVTEWGATGHWECGKTLWGAPIEDDSSTKAGLFKQRYEVAIASDTRHCLGSYVFLWGQKQERTPTWYGLFLPSGESTETVDVMQYLWTGQWPESRCPRVDGFTLDGKTARESVYLTPGRVYPAQLLAQSPSGAPLTYAWEILNESAAQSVGGDHEDTPRRWPGLVAAGADGQAQVTAPAKPGAYRLFAYALDGRGKAAYANIPFYVDVKSATAAPRQ